MFESIKFSYIFLRFQLEYDFQFRALSRDSLQIYHQPSRIIEQVTGAQRNVRLQIIIIAFLENKWMEELELHSKVDEYLKFIVQSTKMNDT